MNIRWAVRELFTRGLTDMRIFATFRANDTVPPVLLVHTGFVET
jgi:hypothetical protein